VLRLRFVVFELFVDFGCIGDFIDICDDGDVVVIGVMVMYDLVICNDVVC